ncbi:MAG: hypothetical protein GY866_14700, partial [Proteobacteria bacterium]|nr:hypothetical protein [Pseudomonadota bacterium]
MKKEIVKQFDGYDDIMKEREISRKHGASAASVKGAVDRCVNLLHPKRLNLRVSDIIEETESTSTFRLVSVDHYLPPFQAGQYIALFTEAAGIRTSRPYSISSPPNQQGYYDVSVRRVENGLVSNYLLDQVHKGDVLESSGPAGHFHYNPLFHDKTMVCLAGGSGITPFMSMISEVLESGLDRTIHLFYGNKDFFDAIFHDVLVGFSERFANFNYHPVIENPPDDYSGAVGYITGSLIEETLGDVEEKTFYL